MSFEEEEVKEDASSAVVKGGDDLQADDPKDKKGSDPKNSKGTSISATVEDEDQDKNVRKTAIVDENGIVKRMIVEKKKGKGYEGIELGPCRCRILGVLAAIDRPLERTESDHPPSHSLQTTFRSRLDLPSR